MDADVSERHHHRRGPGEQVGLSPVLYALMGLIILSTFALAIAYLLLTVRRKPAA